MPFTDSYSGGKYYAASVSAHEMCTLFFRSSPLSHCVFLLFLIPYGPSLLSEQAVAVPHSFLCFWPTVKYFYCVHRMKSPLLSPKPHLGHAVKYTGVDRRRWELEAPMDFACARKVGEHFCAQKLELTPSTSRTTIRSIFVFAVQYLSVLPPGLS